ncbi:MAG: long-chain fatty acid--CoA ligase [Desulfarculaceae bacterium]|nr:long-chain fatty acid--CoA ligase [Desulfarculaceae bacterium]MCF8048551.1 long-chain fatty acid--CoA ligase [Desulfarculaceae bacterium]MCF8066340.1 long-chain fatty acid--CoA ligase [Desulfarculaceae bacterium]MCF8097161.1 long-chain fatty acid--CoA ligase [Desulfarculaceae bacterium]MCF8124179.1 long-chain fatty acid--CoA ligase [Desulfarculaceae bacterium]
MPQFPWLDHYDPEVPHSLEYPSTDLYSLMAQSAAKVAQKTALVFLGKSLSFAQLFSLADDMAGGLAARGIKQGDRVALLMPNCPQFVISYLALMRLGATAMLLNPLNVERELVFKFKDSGARAVIALDLLSQRVSNIRKEIHLDLVVYTGLQDFLPFPKNLLYPIKRSLDKKMPKLAIGHDGATWSFKGLLALKAQAPPVEIDPESMAALIYSGGTTGISKGIMLSHRALIANLMQACAWVNMNHDDSLLAVLPLFHGFGMSVCMNAPLAHGGTVTLLPRFEAGEVLRAIDKTRPSIFAGVPTMFIALKEHPEIDKCDLKSLRGIFVGAAPLPQAVQQEFEKRTGAQLIEGYGLTEAVTAISCNPLYGEKKPGTIGIPFPNVEWRIMDLENGTKEMGQGEAGEIVLRGPDLMTGYLNQPELTSWTIRDGWLYTGDIGVMDQGGYITIVDRKKDLVIVSGFNVFPSEIDEVLHQHPAVAEAVAVGLPHPTKGEFIKAFVVLKKGQAATPEEIRAFCKQNLSAYMVPKEVEIRGELPKSMIGKVLRRSLREEEEAKWAAQQD